MHSATFDASAFQKSCTAPHSMQAPRLQQAGKRTLLFVRHFFSQFFIGHKVLLILKLFSLIDCRKVFFHKIIFLQQIFLGR